MKVASDKLPIRTGVAREPHYSGSAARGGCCTEDKCQPRALENMGESWAAVATYGQPQEA